MRTETPATPVSGGSGAPGRLLASWATLSSWATLLVSVGLLASACQRSATTDVEVFALIDGRPLRLQELEDYARSATEQDPSRLETAVLRSLLDQLLEEELLRELAMERGIVERDASRESAAAALLADVRALGISDQEIEAEYRRRAADFRLAERLLLRQMLFEDDPTAREAQRLLREGVDFEEVGRRLDALGVETVELTPDQLPEAFAEPILALAPGEVTDVLGADYGRHLFQLEGVLPAGRVPLEDASVRIRRWLLVDRLSEHRSALLEEARDRYDVVLLEDRLPFSLGQPVHGQPVEP